jgi:flagellar biosynthesis anti-sigma factor FlgM
MKVDGYQVGKLYESFAGKNSQSTTAGKEPSKAGKPDTVEISDQASDMNNAVALGKKVNELSETPEDRQARVDELKKLIDGGQYNVSSKAVAQSILLGGNLDIRA